MATISTAARNAAADAVVDLLDGGTPPATLRIYGGAKPAGPDTTHVQTLLAALTFSNPAFGAAANGVATAAAITNGTDVGTGTAAWARAGQGGTNSGDAGVIDFTVGTSGADINFNSVSFTNSGAAVSISSLTWTQPAQ